MGEAPTCRNTGYFPVLSQSFPPKSKFEVDQIPDLTGRVVIVTGGNVGIGWETAKILLERNAKVYIATRSKHRADAGIQSLKEATGKNALFLQLDLADLASVKRAADEFLSKETDLHILFNNAGVMWVPHEQLTRDGFDLQWGVNVLGHFFFTELLMPALLVGVETSPDHHARVVTTSSDTAYLDVIQWDSFRDGPARRKMSSGDLYNQSKLGNVIVANQVAKRYGDRGIISISVNPGHIKTELQRNTGALARRLMNATILWPTPRGAITQLYAGTMPEALQYNGEFLIPFARLGKCRPEAYDQAIGERLWNRLQEDVRPFRL